MTADIVQRLIDMGVRVNCPESVDIDETLDLSRIANEGVVIHGGCRIRGRDTYLAQGAEIGAEAPVTLEDCVVGPGVSLRGGYFKEAVFLEGAAMGSGAHVRSGTILEEYASGAHCVGLKQTILFPYVTIGSLVNFCDILMSGGTSRRNHSEVGSSFIHFNYTPNQDKATASLVGDVPCGVMLDALPIFLGGQGGLVGPCAIAYGTVTAAGTILRKDQEQPGRLVIGGNVRGGSLPFQPGTYGSVKRTVHHNLRYLGNLAALEQWYRHVRRHFLPPPLFNGLIRNVRSGYAERCRQLSRFIDRVAISGNHHPPASESLLRQQQTLVNHRTALLEVIEEYPGRELAPSQRDAFIRQFDTALNRAGDMPYLDVIRSLEETVKKDGTRWLQAVVAGLSAAALKTIPDFESPPSSHADDPNPPQPQ